MDERIPAITLKAIGFVKNGVEDTPKEGDWWAELVSEIEIDESLIEGLDEIEGFSHIIVLFWTHKVKRKEAPLKVKPMGKKDGSLVGVFASRSPNRPNRIAKTTVRLLERRANILQVKGLDALNGAPVLDIKPYIPGYDSVDDAEVPNWITRR